MIAKHVPMQSLKKSSFSGLVRYLVSGQNKRERVGVVAVTNCHQDDPLDASLEVQATQSLNTRAESDKTYHLILSFPPNESPPEQVLGAIERDVCNGLGFEKHQRVSAVHHDTDSLHIHIAINKIHPEKLTLHAPWQDYKTLADLCERLEKQYNLQAVNHTPNKQTAENRAADMEHHSGQESLLGWIRTECLNDIKAADSWALLHKALAENGLELQRKGNGFIFVSENGTTVKASTVDRDLSKPKLEARFGQFIPQASQNTTAKRTYSKQPVRSKMDTSDLWHQYKTEQASIDKARFDEKNRLKRKLDREVSAMKRSANLKRASIKLMAEGRASKKLLYSQVSRGVKRDLQSAKDRYKRELQRVLGNRQRQAWADWLRTKATEGDKDALAALRARERKQGLQGNTITASGKRQKTSVQVNQDSITKKGTVIYQVDETVIRDDGERLQLNSDSDHKAILAALELTANQYGQQITVTGSKPFREQVVAVAATHKLEVSFNNKGLAEQHKKLLQQQSHHSVQQRAADNYIAERNEKRQNGLDVQHHRQKQAKDRGSFEYAGLRTVEGSFLALLRKDNEVIVLPVDQGTARRLKRIAINGQVTLDARGKIITKKSRSRSA